MKIRSTFSVAFAITAVAAGAFYSGRAITERRAAKAAPKTIIAEIVLVNCGDYLGTAIITGDGQVHELYPPEGAAIAFGKTLPDGAAMIAHIDDDCRPKQST